MSSILWAAMRFVRGAIIWRAIAGRSRGQLGADLCLSLSLLLPLALRLGSTATSLVHVHLIAAVAQSMPDLPCAQNVSATVDDGVDRPSEDSGRRCRSAFDGGGLAGPAVELVGGLGAWAKKGDVLRFHRYPIRLGAVAESGELTDRGRGGASSGYEEEDCEDSIHWERTVDLCESGKQVPLFNLFSNHGLLSLSNSLSALNQAECCRSP